jgi:lactate racemase
LTEGSIPYGTRAVPLSVSGGRLVRRLMPHTLPPASSPRELLAAALREPIGSDRLSDIARGKRSAAILIPGKARVAGTRDYVAALIAELNAAGMQDDRIAVFLADGTHEQHLRSDIETLLGTGLAARVRCLGHDCRRDEVVELGMTSYGTPVLFNRRVLESEVKILTGRIVPHYFAGFSGGRKALVPGVAGFPTILANHRLTLDPTRGIHPGVRLCSLLQNPVHLDMVEGARMAQPDFCLNTLMDAEDRMLTAVAGDFEAAHQEGCRQALDMLRVVLEEPVDVLISSAGGSPYDDNFMQSLKAVFNVQEVVRPGGTILWVAECSRGINPGFLSWASVESDTELDQAVRERYALTGHNSLMLRQLIRRVEVGLWSGLPPDTVNQLGVHPIASLEEGLSWIRQRHPHGFTYAVVPHANVMCAALEPTGVVKPDERETLGHVA